MSICLSLILASACGAGGPLSSAAGSSPTIGTRTETPSSTQPPYTASLQLPEVTWAGHEAVAAAIDAAVDAWAAQEVGTFSDGVASDLAAVPDLPAYVPESRLTVTYSVTRDSGGALSFALTVEPYYRGAVSPVLIPAGLTFDLRTGQAYTLPTFFRPDADYAGALAQAAAAGLSAWRPDGTRCYLGLSPAAQAATFTAWWLGPQGLVLAFPPGEYTAAYCGVASVTLPYTQLRTIAAKGSPLLG